MVSKTTGPGSIPGVCRTNNGGRPCAGGAFFSTHLWFVFRVIMAENMYHCCFSPHPLVQLWYTRVVSENTIKKNAYHETPRPEQ